VAKLRLLAREYALEEIAVVGTQLKISPMALPDSRQLRLKRIYPSAQYRATTGMVQLPLPRSGSGGIGAERVRDVELLQYIADFVLALDGKAAGSVVMEA
jgi:transcription-repair coupling factor (superfamily II helicase)